MSGRSQFCASMVLMSFSAIAAERPPDPDIMTVSVRNDLMLPSGQTRLAACDPNRNGVGTVTQNKRDLVWNCRDASATVQSTASMSIEEERNTFRMNYTASATTAHTNPPPPPVAFPELFDARAFMSVAMMRSFEPSIHDANYCMTTKGNITVTLFYSEGNIASLANGHKCGPLPFSLNGYRVTIRGGVGARAGGSSRNGGSAEFKLSSPVRILDAMPDSYPEKQNIGYQDCDLLPEVRGLPAGFSFPNSGISLTSDRRFNLTVAYPPGAVINSVNVQVIPKGEAASSISWSVPLAPSQIRSVGPARAQMTIPVMSSTTLPKAPDAIPPFSSFTFRFIVHTSSGASAPYDFPKVERPKTLNWALWRTSPANRFSCREVGGDDWGASATFQALQLLEDVQLRVNDIAIEQGGNWPPHTSHDRGLGIDIYHFPPNLVSTFHGTSNYKALTNFVRRIAEAAEAEAVDVEAERQVTDWVDGQRKGLAGVLRKKTNLNRPVITKILSAPGHWMNVTPTSTGRVVKSDWPDTLLRNGTITIIDGPTVGVVQPPRLVNISGLGPWNEDAAIKARVQPYAGHNNHYHLIVNEEAFQ